MAHNEYAKPSGEEHAVSSVSDLLRRHGHDVRLFIVSSADIGSSIQKKVRAFFSGAYSISARRKISRMLSRENVDLVQVQNLYPLLSPSILVECKQQGIPVVMRCPNYRLFCPTGLHLANGRICERCQEGKEWWCVVKNCAGSVAKSVGYAFRNAVARVTRMITDNVTLFVALSEFQRGRFVAAGINATRIEIVPNIAPTASCESLAPPGEGVTISFVGRFSPEKGIADFLAAARELPEHPFAVAGDSSQAPKETKNAPPNVEFHGFLSGDSLELFYRRTKILVCPSTWLEGFPNVITHAMCTGKPVIASRIGALPEIVDEDVTGLLYEPGNVEHLVEKVRYLLAHPAVCRRMGMAGRQKALRQYPPERHYDLLMAVYQKALALGPGGPETKRRHL